MDTRPGEVSIHFEYTRHVGPRHVHGAVGLQFSRSASFQFTSVALWPGSDDYTAAVATPFGRYCPIILWLFNARTLKSPRPKIGWWQYIKISTSLYGRELTQRLAPPGLRRRACFSFSRPRRCLIISSRFACIWTTARLPMDHFELFPVRTDAAGSRQRKSRRCARSRAKSSVRCQRVAFWQCGRVCCTLLQKPT